MLKFNIIFETACVSVLSFICTIVHVLSFIFYYTLFTNKLGINTRTIHLVEKKCIISGEAVLNHPVYDICLSDVWIHFGNQVQNFSNRSFLCNLLLPLDPPVDWYSSDICFSISAVPSLMLPGSGLHNANL